MTLSPNPQCQAFDDLAEELALGMVDEPRRSELLDHAAGCARCRSTLDGLGSVVDRLLLVAPEVEPPAGFETKVLARLGSTDEVTERRRVPGWGVVAAALLLLGGGFVVGRVVDRSDDVGAGVRAAQIIATTGATVGSVQLLGHPVPHVLVTIDTPRPNPGVRHCELLLPDGTWVEVGTWEVADLTAGVWAVGVSPEQLSAQAMRVTDDAGAVLATARFD